MLEFRLGQQRFFSEQDLALLEEQGFIVKKEFLPREDLATLRCITYEISRKQRDAKSAYFYGNENKAQRIYNLLEKSTEFSDLFISRPAIFEIVHRFFGTNGKHTPYFLSSFQANILGPGTKAQAIHVDNSVPDPLPPWKIRLNINLLLDAFTETNGATLVYPGSQKLLRKPTIKDDASGFMRKIIAPAGSLVVWTGHLWHQSGENISDTPRAALLSCFVASYLREVVAEENYLASINQGRMNELPFEIRTILGYYHGRKTSS
jgi:ectoine hydroxylase-related dioxygenase (phytanoyl-CoA dioxygenase family)